MIFPFASFSLNAKDRIYRDIKNRDWKSLRGAGASATSFYVISALVKYGLEKVYDYFFEGLSTAPEDDEPTAKEEAQKRWDYIAAKMVSSVAEDMLLSGVPVVGDIYQKGANKLWAKVHEKEMNELLSTSKRLKQDILQNPENNLNKLKLEDVNKKIKVLKAVNNIYAQTLGSQYGNYALMGNRLERIIQEGELALDEETEGSEIAILSAIIATDLAGISGFGQADLAAIKRKLYKIIEKNVSSRKKEKNAKESLKQSQLDDRLKESNPN
jgi:hypothetical protein